MKFDTKVVHDILQTAINADEETVFVKLDPVNEYHIRLMDDVGLVHTILKDNVSGIQYRITSKGLDFFWSIGDKWDFVLERKIHCIAEIYEYANFPIFE